MWRPRPLSLLKVCLTGSQNRVSQRAIPQCYLLGNSVFGLCDIQKVVVSQFPDKDSVKVAVKHIPIRIVFWDQSQDFQKVAIRSAIRGCTARQKQSLEPQCDSPNHSSKQRSQAECRE